VATFDYLIIGGGMSGDAAVKGIRQVDKAGTIGVISADSDPPYKRPPLTKDLWHGKELDSIWLKTEKHGISLHLGRKAAEIDPEAKTVVDEQGDSYEYGKLLIATGVRPRSLPFGEDRIIAFRTASDYRRLREATGMGDRFAVIGSGFIGSELASSLAANGKQVRMIFPGEAIGASMFPANLAGFLNDYYREKGVTVLPGEKVVGYSGSHLVTAEKESHETRQIEVDGAISGIGTEPNAEIAEAAGIKVDDGIVVDEQLRTSLPDIWACGDVASYPDAALGRRRVEHEDNARAMGRRAGRNMAGETEPYTHLPMFYSDLFDLGYEAVGEIDAKLDIVADWKTEFVEGVVYYLKDDRVRGVLLWGVWEQVDVARGLITLGEPIDERDLRGRIPEGA
jgi:NADPH-dependent 2,4-dienoyl-CoA reductase/sulfur reductase-like enzyme